MDTTYYDPSVITPEMDALALEFLSYIKEFEWGFVYDFPTALKTSPLGIAIPIPAPTSLWNQQYVPYTGGRITQHCVCLYRYDGTQTYPNYVTDQYQPFLKQLQNNYMIPVAISFKVILKQTPTSVPIVVKKPFWPRWITSLFTKW